MRQRAFFKVILLLFFAGFISPSPAPAQKCEPGDDRLRGFKIKNVRISSPLGWLPGAVDDTLDALLAEPEMPRGGEEFDKARADAAFIWLARRFPDLQPGPQARVAVRFSRYSVENCDFGAGELDLVYHVYTFQPSLHLLKTFEINKDSHLRRAVPENEKTKALARFFVRPFVGYDQSRKVIAGADLAVKFKESSDDKLDVKFAASPNSLEAGAALNFAREKTEGAIRYREMRFGFAHSDLPAPNAELRQTGAFGQIYAATRAFTNKEIVIRFGAEAGAGEQRTTVSAGSLPASIVEDDGFASLKTFVGATASVGRHSFKASYGLKFGSAERAVGLDYIKQVFDAAASLRFPVSGRRHVDLQLELAGGAIRTYGKLPLREKFFGGHTVDNFIGGDKWFVRADPLIRSFPSNRLAQVDASSSLGGDSFTAFNLTASYPVYRRPLVPVEVWQDPANPGEMSEKLKEQLDFNFDRQRDVLKFVYLAESPKYGEIISNIRELRGFVAELKSELKKIPAPEPGGDLDVQLKRLFKEEKSGRFDRVETSVNTIIGDYTGGGSNLPDLSNLLVGVPELDEPSYLGELEETLEAVKPLLPDERSAAIAAAQAGIKNESRSAAGLLRELEASTAAKEAEVKAERDIAYSRKVINYIIRDANLIAVSPVFIFDAARLKQRGVDGAGFRYGVGGGVKVNFISLDVTAAYVFNPRPKPWEPRGAVFFKFDVSDPFK